MPRLVFHCCWTHSTRVLVRAEVRYVNLMVLSSGLPAKLDDARSDFAMVTSYFWNVSSLS